MKNKIKNKKGNKKIKKTINPLWIKVQNNKMSNLKNLILKKK